MTDNNDNWSTVQSYSVNIKLICKQTPDLPPHHLLKPPPHKFQSIVGAFTNNQVKCWVLRGSDGQLAIIFVGT